MVGVDHADSRSRLPLVSGPAAGEFPTGAIALCDDDWFLLLGGKARSSIHAGGVNIACFRWISCAWGGKQMGTAKITGVLGEATVQIVVEKERRILDAMRRDPPTYPRVGGQPPGHRRQCRRQVYSERGVAENTARVLAERKIAVAEVERCSVCGMLHLLELKST